MEKSLRFDTVKRHYDNNAWDKGQVADAVGRWITAEEYEEITGEAYEQAEGPSQLDRIEKTVNKMAEDGTSWDSMAMAIAEGVNEV